MPPPVTRYTPSMKRKSEASHDKGVNGVTKRRAVSPRSIEHRFREALFDEKQLLHFKSEYASSEP